MKLNLSPPQKDILFTSLAALVLVLLSVWLMRWAVVVEIPPEGNDRFGICFISGPDHPADEIRYSGALTTGARWNRWPLYWHWVAEGGYTGFHDDEKHDYDTLVTQDLAHHLTPIVILMGTPGRYAAQSPPTPIQPHGQESLILTSRVATASMATAPPLYLDEPIFADGSDEPAPGKTVNPANVWAGFVFRTVERYRPGGLLAQQKGWPDGVGVRYWEIWNEPDYSSFWTGTVAEYRQLLEVAYKTIKAADPQAVVLLGGLAFYDRPDWFLELLKQTGGRPEQAYFDVLSFHHYLNIYNSEARLLESRAALDTYSLSHIPIWITESGVSVWDDYPAVVYEVPPTEPLRSTMPEQAAYIIQNAALSFYNGVERYYHFMLHDDCGDGPSSAYGLRQNFTPHSCNPAEGRLRPAYAAYQLAAQQFHDIRPLWRQKMAEQDQVAFYREYDASRLLTLWATTGMTVTTVISAIGDQAQLYWIEPSTTTSAAMALSRTLTLTPTDGLYRLTLPPATNQNSPLPDDPTYQIGGPPYLLIERDMQPPRASLNLLPPISPERIWLRWQGQDPGSGIGGYDIWVSEDGGPLQPWLAGAVITQTHYTGRAGHTYGFAVRARDRAGNDMPAPSQAETATRVTAGLPVSGLVLSPDNKPAARARVVVNGLNTQESLTTDQQGFWGPLNLLAGEYTFQADAGGDLYPAWPAPRRLLIETSNWLTLTLAPPANVLLAGDFEGDDVWAVWDWQGQVNRSIDAFDGLFGVRLGDGEGEPIICPGDGRAGQVWAVRQKVVLPDEPSSLSFLYKISTSRAGADNAWLEVGLWAGNEQHILVPPGELQQPTDWRLVSVDLSAWRAQEIEAQFQVVRCSEEPFRVTIDRVSIGGMITN